ncbi:MAG TPA: DUF3427 domain-containing protein [Planctomycetota bacterium]|jgi:superfamily II DNA or RNA helicase/HKD family nuclease
MPESSLPDGLYDAVVTGNLAHALRELARPDQISTEPLSREEAAQRLARVLSSSLADALDAMPGDGAKKERSQVDLVNALLASLHQATPRIVAENTIVQPPPRVLRAVHQSSDPAESPRTGLEQAWLFTAGRSEPSLLSELRLELGAVNQVDMLVSFITRAGVRRIWDLLQQATAVNASGAPRTRIRVVTTTYTGATDADALDDLARLPGVEVRVSLDGRRTRLHAKAWIFHRATGFGSAYVGSANLSGAALLGGLEWTVKFTEMGQPDLFRRAAAHFETLWNDPEFQPYNPDKAEQAQQLRRALQVESGESSPVLQTWFDLQPKQYQQVMLDRLAAERRHGRDRNLVVAATGTGKTLIAAFDYRRACAETGGRPRLLFVAHREEILRQTQRMFQAVLRDGSFGELLLGGAQPGSHDHLFATIDSVASRGLVERLGADYWHNVVIDECHRMAAERFDAFARAIRPRILLGLTATPERGDGQTIFRYFDNRPDGSPAVELRLWDALDQQLLAPFEYYGCDDPATDLSEVPWDQVGERAALERVLTGNDARARLVIDEWRRLTGDVRRSKALVFCVSVAHARFMTARFNANGIPAACVVGETPDDDRRRAPERLARGEVCALVTCDLYNEGIDLPSVNTLLLLRPTQSPVLFQQQIGRGLRLYEGKQSCLVLDFVGRHRADFRFDRLFSAITGLTRTQLVDAVRSGFGSLPPGCHIQLQPVVRERVLASLRAVANQTWPRLRAELSAFVALKGRANLTLANFLAHQGIEIEDVYRDRAPSGWAALRRAAGLETSPAGSEEEYFGRRFAELLHADDPEYLKTCQRAAEESAEYSAFEEKDRRRLQMLTYQIDGRYDQVGSGEQLLQRLENNPHARDDLRELAQVLVNRTTMDVRPIPGLEDIPLCLHASYQIREILTAVGWLTAEHRTPFQAGVLALDDRRTELLFVTLDKSEGYHAGIAYQDYAISRELFHWQTQNAAGPTTPSGRRYIESPANGWTFQLFVRESRAHPYRPLGPATVEKYQGAKPMSIQARLRVPLAEELFGRYSVLRG